MKEIKEVLVLGGWMTMCLITLLALLAVLINSLCKTQPNESDPETTLVITRVILPLFVGFVALVIVGGLAWTWFGKEHPFYVLGAIGVAMFGIPLILVPWARFCTRCSKNGWRLSLNSVLSRRRIAYAGEQSTA